MLARGTLAALLLLTPASAVHVKLSERFMLSGDPTILARDNFAYVSTLMWSKDMAHVEETKAFEANRNAALKETMEEESLIPQGGHKMYGPNMVFKIDNQLREQGAKYPYIVVTDDQRLIESPELKNHPNIKLVQVGRDVEFVGQKVDGKSLARKVAIRNQLHIQKLSVFNMTQYDKLLSLDLDISVKANLDHIFKDYDTKNGAQVYGMYNDFNCTNAKTHEGDYFNSALMLLEPKGDTFKDLMAFFHKEKGFYGDQAVVQQFFRHQKSQPQIFPKSLADFGQCKERMSSNARKGKPVEVVHMR